MCQSKADGGERCAAHTGQELTKAMETAKNEPSAVNNAELMKAMEAYNRTATGTKELRERGDKASIELAEKYEAERASRLKARREAKTPKSGIVKASFQEGNEEPQLFTVTYTEGKREEAYNEANANAMKAMKTTGRGGSVKTLYAQEEVFDERTVPVGAPKSGIVKANFQEGNEEPQLFTVTYTEGKREEAYNEAYANAMKAMKTTGRGGSVKTLYEQEEIFEVG